MPHLTTYQTRIIPDWVDYNGHLRDAFYLLIFSYATDALMDRLGMDSNNREASGHSLFTLELHLNYLHEVKLDTEAEVRTQIIGHDSKRLHLYHSLHKVGDEQELAATNKCSCTSTSPARARRRLARTHWAACKASSPSKMTCPLPLTSAASSRCRLQGKSINRKEPP